MPPVILDRYPHNPILRPVPSNAFEAQNVSNAGAVMHDGRIHILYRAEGYEKRVPLTKEWPVTSLGLAVSSDGFSIDERLTYPVIGPEPNGEFGEHGIQDPRIACVDGTFYVTTAGVSRWGDRVILYRSCDLRCFEKVRVIQPWHEMRTAGMFPALFGGRYCFLLRYQPNMWISYTDDFINWYDTKLLFEIRRQSWFGRKLGIGATPIRQDDAWLLFWHGKSDTLDGTYSLGVMWLDLEDPSRIIRVQEEPVLTVETDYEKTGYYPNVVYSCGTVEKDGIYLVYYGCADRVLSVATVPVADCSLC
ncbi:MAG: hypothetical protein JW909_13470 [Planctomycetes bacterium]|nr:hypothetical protein [Planctomycetota bacterium]